MRSPYRPLRAAAPSVTPVSLAQAQAAGLSGDTGLISMMIDAATQCLDGWAGILGRCLINQTWTQTFDGFFERLVHNWQLSAGPIDRRRDHRERYRLRLPFDVSSITSITYLDANAATQTLATNQYVLRTDNLGSFVEPAPLCDWPETVLRHEAVTVTFVAGYGAAATDVPAPIRQAILTMVRNLYSMASRDATLRIDAVVGVGSQTFETGEYAGQGIDRAVMALLTPYRVVDL